MKIHTLLFPAMLALTATPAPAAEVNLTGDYLSGKWSSAGKEGCGSNAAEYVSFHAHGTMDAGRGTTPRAVGFWRIDGDEITVHLLVAPDESDASNVFYRGRYNYSYLTATILDAREDAFDTISGTTGAMTRNTFTKCE